MADGADIDNATPLPDPAPEQEAVAAAAAAETPAKKNIFRRGWDKTVKAAKYIAAIPGRFWAATKRKASISWKFTKELFSDHAFWVKALAVKGGASAIGVTGLVAITSVYSVPLIVMIAGGAVALGVAAAGIYGMAAGVMKGIEHVQDVYARATGKAPKEHVYKERKDIIQRLAETKFIKNLAEKPWAKAIAGTHAWKTTMKFTSRKEDSLLGGIAVGGAVMSIIVGAVALPALATIGVLTTAGVFAITSIASGMSGLYFSITGIREERRMKAEHLAKEKAEKAKRWNPGAFFGWGAAANSSLKPTVGEDAPFTPIGHSFLPPLPDSLKTGDSKPLAASFGPAANDDSAPSQTAHKPAPYAAKTASPDTPAA